MVTCMACSAVDTEVTCSLDADSFIQTLRHFITKHGNIWIFWSENGKNFIGTEIESWKASLEKVQIKVKDFLGLEGIGSFHGNLQKFHGNPLRFL